MRIRSREEDVVGPSHVFSKTACIALRHYQSGRATNHANRYPDYAMSLFRSLATVDIALRMALSSISPDVIGL